MSWRHLADMQIRLKCKSPKTSTNHTFFFKKIFLSIFVGPIHMSYFGGTGTPVLDFWWHFPWVSKPEWVLPYSHCGGKCNVHFLRSTSGATHCRPLEGQHCGASTGFISCPRILLCGSSESRTRDQPYLICIKFIHNHTNSGEHENSYKWQK